MFLVIILLAVIAWLLWSIREDLEQLAYRQRDQSVNLERLIQRLEGGAATPAGPAQTATPAAPVNLNTASRTELQALPKIGGVSADHIIAARPFTEVAQLAAVSGISPAVFDDLKGRVTI